MQCEHLNSRQQLWWHRCANCGAVRFLPHGSWTSRTELLELGAGTRKVEDLLQHGMKHDVDLLDLVEMWVAREPWTAATALAKACEERPLV